MDTRMTFFDLILQSKKPACISQGILTFGDDLDNIKIDRLAIIRH